MTNSEAIELMKTLPNHGKEVSKILQEILRRHGVTGKMMDNGLVQHSIRHGYRKLENVLRVTGRMYCQELSELLPQPPASDFKSPEEASKWRWVIYGYSLPLVMGWSDNLFDLGEYDSKVVSDYLEEMVSNVFCPLVKAVQTPVQAVEYALEHHRVLQFAGQKPQVMLDAWTKHYGLEFKSKL